MQHKMKPSDLIAFLIKEAQHCVINNERMQNLDQALAAHVKRKGKGKATRAKGDEKAPNADSDVVCHNCKKKGHKKADCCWGGKEGQGPKQKKGKGKKSEMATVAAVDDDDKELFTFTCMSDFANVAKALQVPKSWLGMCINSGASRVYSPGSSKFANYKSIDCSITMADG